MANEGYKAYSTQYPAATTPASEFVAAEASLVPAHVPARHDYKTVMAERALFQSIASMGLPAFTIHSAVKYSGKYLKDSKNVRLRTWGPIGLGLSIVPALPFMFDEPVEHAVEWAFDNAFLLFQGQKEKEL